jgi:hypothetical protein
MHQQQQNDPMNWKRNFNILAWFCLVHGRALTLLIRSRNGKDSLGVPCALALVMMFLWATFTQDTLIWVWMAVWFFFLIVRRVETVWLTRRGERIHSQYDGWPGPAYWFCRSERIAKLIIEPTLFAIVGALLYGSYEQAGLSPRGMPWFLLAGMFTLPFVECVKQTIQERCTQGMLDARIEQEAMMDEFRDKYGES